MGPPADGNLITATTDLQDTATGSDAGFVTNHLPFTSGQSQCGSAQSDQQPAGFTGEATKGTTHPGAYNFAVQVSSANASIWIYNAPYSPTDPAQSCNGSQQLDTYFQDDSCSTFYNQYGPLTFDGSHFDDPRFAFDTTYSVYRVPSTYSRITDQLLTGSPQTFHPMDEVSADLSAHGCSGAYDMTQVSTYSANLLGKIISFGQGCVSTPSSNGAYTWTKLNADIDKVGLYRLAVEATPFVPTADPNPTCADGFMCGWGRHSYAIAVCSNGNAPAGGNCQSGGIISAWNNMNLYLNFPSAKKNIYIPIAYIPSSYAGRTVTISMFNPGDSHGHGDNAYYLLVPPDPCITVSYPTPTGGNNWVRQATYGGTVSPVLAPNGSCTQQTNGVFAAQRNGGNNPSDDLYNGVWVPMTFTLPTSFTGGQFWLDEYSDQGKNFEDMAVSAAINGGSPEHLIF
jgi:hypothetical protein